MDMDVDFGQRVFYISMLKHKSKECAQPEIQVT